MKRLKNGAKPSVRRKTARGAVTSPSKATVPSDAKKRRNASQTEAAVDLIRSRIIDMSLEPGSKLDEPLLINHFKLGRTPAREAINRLIAEGLVNIFPNRGGTFVRGLDFGEIGEVLVANQLVESVLAQLCRFDDPGLVQDLEEIQARYTGEVRMKSFLGITSTNQEFHLRMHRSIGNALFYEFALSTHRHVRRLLVLVYKMENTKKSLLESRLQINLNEHLQIIDAIRHSDRGALNELLPAHARQTQTRLQEILNDKTVPPLSLDRLTSDIFGMMPFSKATRG
ncbi:GntR family transcriptional regulator [Bradyrhizobium sp. Ash2021]|uniref:GntR family transcriptional regulator n=1 Tax=Bradyrhizobium sp. Ash2021 TaxID=2954771 RepID=UPI002815B589|nr:GntR family transcriptional regulator [Bradyrhizobium sp. Ash2021]WMT79612.1 GntR family transcriptional regulator [Bradyrhizobium sp. Ash2021]